MFPIGDQIDPEIPTDPNELVLYKKYGKNWRDVISGRKYSRDRGGNRDRGMRFMHTTPEGFMTRPTPPMSPQQMMRSDIDQSGYMSQMQKMQDDYNRMLQEWYSLTGSSAYQEQQDYYAGNYESMYGTGGGSQDYPYSAPPEAAPAAAAAVAAAAAAPAGSTGIAGGGLSALSKVASPPAPVLMPNQPATRGGDSLFGGYGSQRAPAAPAAPVAAAPSMSDQFIARYERAEATGNDNPKVKTVAPVKTVVKSATPVKVWGNRNN